MKRHVSLVLFATLALVYVAAGIWTTRRVGPTGDEPFYLLAADSLLHGESFNLDRRWSEIATSGYDPGDHLAELPRQTSPSLRAPGHYPLHDLGLSVFLALPFAAGGRALAVAIIAVAMAGAVALAHRASRTLTNPRAALAGTIIAGLSVPALTYSGQLFPDSLAPLAVAASVAALLGAAPLWAGALGVAALPFLHLRAWPLAIALLLLLLRGRPLSQQVRLCAPLALVVLGSSLLDLAIYGVPVPHAGFLLFFSARADTSVAAYTSATPFGLAGLFVDRAFGLLPAAPIALLAFVGAGMTLRRRMWLALVPIPYLVLASALDWTAAVSPQARYLAPLVPFLVLYLGVALEARPARLAALPLGLWTAAMSTVYIAVPGVRYDSFGVAPYADRTWDQVVGFHTSGVFPLLGADGATGALLAAWVVLLALLVVAGAAMTAVTRVSSVAQSMVGDARR